jgi:hypothetical protein
MGVRVTGLTEVIEGIGRVKREMNQTERDLLAFGERVEQLTRASAESAQTPEGAAWAPRKAVTVRRGGRSAGRRTAEPGSLGVKTGRMLRSITVTVRKNVARLTVGTGGARYAKYFLGYSSRQPARPILPTHETGSSAGWLDAWLERLADGWMRALDG